MSAAEDLLYYDDIMKGEATQHDMGRHGTTIIQRVVAHQSKNPKFYFRFSLDNLIAVR